MTQPYSKELRARALARYEAGETNRAIGQALSISPSCIPKWRKINQETGALAPGQNGGHKKAVLSGEQGIWLAERLRREPLTLRGPAAELVERGVKTNRRAVWVFVLAQVLSFKKRCGRASRIGRTSRVSVGAGRGVRPPSIRAGWCSLTQPFGSSTRLGSRPTWPRCAVGDRADRAWRPRYRTGHWRTLTFIAALRHDRVTAPCVIDGPINGAIFRNYVETVLVPTLDLGDVVIQDNLGSHKGKAARAAAARPTPISCSGRPTVRI